tara:strand:- start:282 stop:809 length:528 start_codon:yes stop_codon:yes gene_type:complete
MKYIFIYIIIFFVFSCKENTARYPLNKKKQLFLNNSASRNKALLAREEFLMKKASKADSNRKFQISEKGFLFAYIKSVSKQKLLPIKGTKVRFQYQIEDLEKNILYPQTKLGIVNYTVDQEDLLPALREGIRIMRLGEVVVFLFPSYLCYGYQGDGDKIGVNQPLRFIIERLPIN